MKIFYNKTSIDCEAAVYLIAKHLQLDEKTFSESLHDIHELKDSNTIANINTTDIVFIVGWHSLTTDKYATLLNMTSNIYWYSAEEESIKFVEEHPEFKPAILCGLVESGENTKTSMLVYLQMFTDYIKPTTTNIHRYLRKTYDIAPTWLQYMNMTFPSDRSERFRYAIEKEMEGPNDPKWRWFDKSGVGGMAEVVKWIDRGQSLMEKDRKDKAQESLLQRQGEKPVYKTPDSWKI